MLNKHQLENFLCELEIEATHKDIIFNVLDKIKSNAKAQNVFDSFYIPYMEKGELDYNAFYKEALPELWEILPDIHKYTINLATLFAMAPHSEHFYTEKGFEKASKVSDKVAKVAHFDSGEDNYFVNKEGALVLNDMEKVVLKNYAGSSVNGKTKLAFTEVGTGKKDKQGNEIMKQTAYVISGDKAQEVPAAFSQKQVVDKGNMFAYYTSYDYKSSAGEVILYNGEKAFSIGKKVSMIYKFA